MALLLNHILHDGVRPFVVKQAKSVIKGVFFITISALSPDAHSGNQSIIPSVFRNHAYPVSDSIFCTFYPDLLTMETYFSGIQFINTKDRG